MSWLPLPLASSVQPGFPLPRSSDLPTSAWASPDLRTSASPKLSSRARSWSARFCVCAVQPWRVRQRTRTSVRSSLVAAASSRLRAAQRVGSSPTAGSSYTGWMSLHRAFIQIRLFEDEGVSLCNRRAKEQKRFLAAGKSIPPRAPVPPEGAVPAPVGLPSSGRQLCFLTSQGAQDTLGMHPGTDPEACGGSRSEVGPVVMKFRSGRGGRGGQAWLLDPGEDFRLCPEGDEWSLKDLKGRAGTGRVDAAERLLWLQSGGSWLWGPAVWRQLALLPLAELGAGAICLLPWAWRRCRRRRLVQLQPFPSPLGLV